jgi:hypothetical protein
MRSPMPDPRSPVRALAARCREETLRFLRHQPRDDTFCFELFTHAVAERDDAAWEAIVDQYRWIVLAFVRQHAAAASLGESDDFWVNRAFQRFWLAVNPERFSSFRDLPGVLKYLKLCVHSVLLDEVRARRTSHSTSLQALASDVPAQGNTADAVLDGLARQQLWTAVLNEAQDGAERQVAVLSFARGLKPGEVQARHPHLFATVADVYRVKRNLVERLRRSPQIRSFLA